MALVVTPGAADANSFATVAEFQAYKVNRYPQIAWAVAAVDAMIEAMLIAAARGLNSNFIWTGAAVDDVQAMTWPRSGMLTRNGFGIASTAIPVDLKNAQCEYALQIGATNLLSDNDAVKKGIASVKAGSVALSFQSVDTSSQESVEMYIRRMGSEFNYVSDAVPGEVRRLLVPSWFEQPTMVRPPIFLVS